MESVNKVKQALSKRSRTATLDELRDEGRKKVRIIRAEHVASMIEEAVQSAVEQSGLTDPEEVSKLVDKSRQEFRAILKERERANDMASKLEERERELAELKERLEQMSAGPAAKGGGGGVAASPEAVADFSAAIEKLQGSINDRLEKIGKKMGVSAAVEADTPVNLAGLFRDDDKQLESNMDKVEVKQTAGGGIAANLAKLKKLKGGS